MSYFVGPNGTDVMVPRDLCERLDAALADAGQEELRQELQSHRKQRDLSHPRSTAAGAVVLELDPSTIPRN